MKSSADSQPPANPLSAVTLEVRGLGHIPAIKNSMFAIVDKKNREWKRRCVRSFVSQLLSSTQTTEHEIQTPHSLRSLIASLPQDDSWKDIPQISIQCVKVPKGDEGANLMISQPL